MAQEAVVEGGDAGTPTAEQAANSLAARIPGVARELARLRPLPQQKLTAEIRPPASTLVTLAVAGAVLHKPGVHYVRFPSVDADYRPEVARMALDLLPDDPEIQLVFLTDRTRAIQYAVSDL